MSSRRAVISRRDRPITDPTRYTLSMASSSGFQPTPSSRIGVMPRRPRHRAGIGRINAAQHLQQRALPRAVASHDADVSPGLHGEADVVEHLKPLHGRRLEHARTRVPGPSSRRTLGMRNALETDWTSISGAAHQSTPPRAAPGALKTAMPAAHDRKRYSQIGQMRLRSARDRRPGRIARTR